MRILLAGGAGFLGSHLAEALVARGDYVVILDNLLSGLAANISRINKKVKFVNAVVSNYKTEETFDLVMNLASRVSRKEWESFPVEVADLDP